MNRYPLGPLPQDILRIIASNSPQVYGRLAPVSSRVRATITPVLPQICDSPPSIREIINLLMRSDIRYLILEKIGVLPGGEISDKINFIFYPPQENQVYGYLELLEPEFEELIPSFLRHLRGVLIVASAGSLSSLLSGLAHHGYNFLPLYTLYEIYSNRTSCMNRDVYYALRKVWEDFQVRFQKYISLARQNINNIDIDQVATEVIGVYVDNFLEILDDSDLINEWDEYLENTPYPMEDPRRIEYLENFLPVITVAVNKKLSRSFSTTGQLPLLPRQISPEVLANRLTRFGPVAE